MFNVFYDAILGILGRVRLDNSRKLTAAYATPCSARRTASLLLESEVAKVHLTFYDFDEVVDDELVPCRVCNIAYSEGEQTEKRTEKRKVWVAEKQFPDFISASTVLAAKALAELELNQHVACDYEPKLVSALRQSVHRTY